MRHLLNVCLILLTMVSVDLSAKNGETGVLIILHKFDILYDGHKETVTICTRDYQRVLEAFQQGLLPELELKDLGLFPVEISRHGLKFTHYDTDLDQATCLGHGNDLGDSTEEIGQPLSQDQHILDLHHDSSLEQEEFDSEP